MSDDGIGMAWRLSHRADRKALPLADRHYNRQKSGTPQFVPPGRCVVLLTPEVDALWVSSWPFAEYTKHEWAGAWVCSCFRNESRRLSSELIRQAEAVTRSIWGDPPSLGMVSFVDRDKTRRKRDPGRCYLRAGWAYVGCHKWRSTCSRCFDRGYRVRSDQGWSRGRSSPSPGCTRARAGGRGSPPLLCQSRHSPLLGPARLAIGPVRLRRLADPFFVTIPLAIVLHIGRIGVNRIIDATYRGRP